MHNLTQRLANMRRPGNSVEALVADLKASASDGGRGLLEQIIASGDDLIKCEAMDVLRLIDVSRALAQARSLLDAPNLDVRRAVCEILGDMTNPNAETLLLDHLKHEQSPDVRCGAVGALRLMGSSASLATLRDIVSRDNSADFEGRPISKLALAAIAEIQSRANAQRDGK